MASWEKRTHVQFSQDSHLVYSLCKVWLDALDSFCFQHLPDSLFLLHLKKSRDSKTTWNWKMSKGSMKIIRIYQKVMKEELENTDELEGEKNVLFQWFFALLKLDTIQPKLGKLKGSPCSPEVPWPT